MRRIIAILIVCFSVQTIFAQQPFGRGKITVQQVAHNAVRIQYTEGDVQNDLPDWLYVKHDVVKNSDVKIKVDKKHQRLFIKDKDGKTVFTATRHQFDGNEATLTFLSPKDECQFGLGQFQDGYSNVRGLSRRLTQVNTQISLPMLISSKGYGTLPITIPADATYVSLPPTLNDTCCRTVAWSLAYIL
jgi:alpha-D-xyloside xylohydrolase